MAAAAKIRIAEQIEVTWLDAARQRGTCPNCGRTGEMTAQLEIDYRPPDAAHRFILQICPHCTARFVDNPETMDYGSDELIELGWHRYQVQLGAGVWPISEPLTRIDQPAGARILEIGGAYGFGLDFGVRARGWQGVGYDPSPLAAFGARELGLTLHQRYFGPEDVSDGPWDVVVATEVIEHLAEPPAFLALLRRAVAPRGILVLTTPDAEWITPELPPSALMSLLSPGAHRVVQTASSLRAALQAAGFAEVTIRREATSLVAYASPSPFALLDAPAQGRAMFRRYLVERAALTAETSDLRLGFAGRGLFEAANDGDMAAADAAWAALRSACRARFGLDLDALAELPEAAGQKSLAELAELMPLGLGMILFGRVMRLAGAEADRRTLLPKLRLAQAAIAALQSALARRSLIDGLSADIGRVIADEILLCQAESADPASLPGLLAGGEALRWRGLVALVNAEALELAAPLAASLPALPGPELPPALRRNALLSLANFALAPGQDPAAALPAADALGEAEPRYDAILLAAFTRLVNGSRYAEARAAERRYGIAARARNLAGSVAARDAGLALTVLDLAAGDPAEVPARLAGLDLPAAQRDALLFGAFTGLVNSGRHAEAEALAAGEACFARLDAAQGAAAADARIGWVLLDLQRDRPEAALRRIDALAGRGADPALLGPLRVQGFVRLVNAGKFGPAAELARAGGVAPYLAGCPPELRLDARCAELVLELQPGGAPARIVQRVEALVAAEAPEARLEELALAAFVTLVNASEYGAARRLRRLVEPMLLKLKPPFTPAGRNALFAAGMLYLQERDDWRRSAASFARLRDALLKETPEGATPDPLFWPGLRGEILALHRLNRGAEAGGLLAAMAAAYPGAPEDLRAQLQGAAP